MLQAKDRGSTPGRWRICLFTTASRRSELEHAGKSVSRVKHRRRVDVLSTPSTAKV